MALDTGSVYNVASVTSEDTKGNPITDSDDETITANQNPLLQLLKEGVFNDENGDGFAEPGETVTFSFLVTNQGNVTLNNLFITDPVIGINSLAVTPGILSPGQSGVANASYILTPEVIESGGIYNIAEVTGTTRNSTIVRSPSNDPTPLDPMNPNYNDQCPNCTFINLERPSSISNFVWHDIDGNGIQNPEEPGIPNTYVHLYLADGTYLRSVLTNSGGFYLFDYVVPGNYQIRFDIPPSYTPTFRNVGNLNNDSNIDQQ